MMKKVYLTAGLLAISILTTGCMPTGYERENNMGAFSFMLGRPLYQCANINFSSSKISNSLNLKLGKKNAPTQKVSSIDGINSEENSKQKANQSGVLSCHATVTYENGARESGTVYLQYPGDSGDSAVGWVSDKDMPELKARQESDKSQTIKNDKDKLDRFYSDRPIKDFPYLAEISCGYGNASKGSPFMCMTYRSINTQIEVRNGEEYSMVQVPNLNIPNSIYAENGILVLLRPTFSMRMQNASDTFTMNLKIIDRRNNALAYQKSAGQYDYIRANNNLLSIQKSEPTPQEANNQNTPFIAEISCGNQPIFSCFMGQGGRAGSYNTNLEVRSGDEYKLYQYQELMRKGQLFNLPLRSAFSIRAQNANNNLILNIKILDKKSGKVLFEKSAGQYDYIYIKN